MSTRLSQVLVAAVGLFSLYPLFLSVKSVFLSVISVPGMFFTWIRMVRSEYSEYYPVSSYEAFVFAFSRSSASEKFIDALRGFIDALLFGGVVVALIIGLLIFNFVVHDKVTIWPK